MIAVIGAISLVSMLAAATLAATNGDVNLVQYDLNHRRAHAAAEAGIADYSFHLNNDNSYWARCTDRAGTERGQPAGGSTAKLRSVPGPAGESYAIELLPASSYGHSKCETRKPSESMLEQGGTNTGSFRIRSTGYAGSAKVSLVATYKRASFLDYIYFTHYETSDPVTYGNATRSSYAYDHCAKFRREGRESQAIPGSRGQYCSTIVFVSGDHIKARCTPTTTWRSAATPEFGRTASDVIEVGAPRPAGSTADCSATARPTRLSPARW